MKRIWSITLAALFVMAVEQPLQAQNASSAKEETLSVLDGVYTRSQASRGEQVFLQECSLCHGAAQFTGSAFQKGWTGRTANDLFEFIRTSMPFDAPGRLSLDQYADIIAHIFSLNDLPPGDEELRGETEHLERIHITEWKKK